MRTRIKICGLTRDEDLLAAVEAGADAIGLVCYAGSKRYVTIERAAQLRQLVPSFVSVVALFVNAKSQFVRDVISQVKPDFLQFHGDESVQECECYDHPYLRALRVGALGLDTSAGLAQACQQYDCAAAWLFDRDTPGYGGSGQTFEHTLLSDLPVDRRRVILAGGLNELNVQASVCRLRPWAVDVSSGVEISPGVKSAQKIDAFINAVHTADRCTSLS